MFSTRQPVGNRACCPDDQIGLILIWKRRVGGLESAPSAARLHADGGPANWAVTSKVCACVGGPRDSREATAAVPARDASRHSIRSRKKRRGSLLGCRVASSCERDVVVLERDRANALAGGGKKRVEHGGRGDEDRRLA